MYKLLAYCFILDIIWICSTTWKWWQLLVCVCVCVYDTYWETLWLSIALDTVSNEALQWSFIPSVSSVLKEQCSVIIPRQSMQIHTVSCLLWTNAHMLYTTSQKTKACNAGTAQSVHCSYLTIFMPVCHSPAYYFFPTTYFISHFEWHFKIQYTTTFLQLAKGHTKK